MIDEIFELFKILFLCYKYFALAIKIQRSYLVVLTSVPPQITNKYSYLIKKNDKGKYDHPI